MKKLLLISLCTLATLGAGATDYYAAPGATGDGSSYDKPGDIVKLAANKNLKAGDKIYLEDGVYMLTTGVDLKYGSGAEGNEIFIGAYPGAHPILDGSKLEYGGNNSHCLRIRKPYIHVKDITVRYAGNKGIYACADNITLENIDAYGNVDSGIQFKDATGCVALNCDSHANFDYETGGLGSPDWGGNADGFADKQYTKGGNKYINCRSWDNSDDGWDLYKHVTNGTPVYFENCITYNNSPEYYDFTDNPRTETDAAWFASVEGKTVTTTKKVTVEMHKNHYYNNGNKNGFKIGGSKQPTDVVMYRCLAINNTKKGFDQNYTTGNVKLYNCTGIGNYSNFNFNDDIGETVDIRNCISYKNGAWGDVFHITNFTHSSNSWDLGLEGTDADFNSTDGALSTAARNSDGTYNMPTLATLTAGSQFIDKGEVISGYTDDVKDGKPDLGWKEYVALAPTAIKSIDNNLNGARRLNVYTMNGELVGMVADGNIDKLNLQHGMYIVKDFDSNKAVKIVK